MLDFAAKNNTGGKLVIWDGEGELLTGNWTTVLWSDYAVDDKSDIISIPSLVEEHADELKARYLAWVYEMGELRVKGKRLVDHLELRPGFSYWWMTSIGQKFNASGASNINNAIKLFVIEGLIEQLDICSVVLISENKNVARVLDTYCKKIKITFRFEFSPPLKRCSSSAIKNIYQRTPDIFRAIVCLFRYMTSILSILINSQPPASIPSADICFVDVLVHLDKSTFNTGRFISNYWTRLVGCLSKTGIKTNWFHNYIKQKDIESPAQAEVLINRFNKSVGQFHNLIESNLSIAIIRRGLQDYFKLIKVKIALSKKWQHFSSAESNLDFWALFEKEWNESLCGPSGMINCIRLSLYEKTFSEVLPQRIGVYILENQPWEMALIYTWKAGGHGKLVGVPHTTVRFWDLRYFYDRRSYTRSGTNMLPLPNLVAVNSPAATRMYHHWGYPKSQTVEVEALRYLNLHKFAGKRTGERSSALALTVLVCGDFLSSTNEKMLNWLSVAKQHLPPETLYMFKPHPAFPVDLSKFEHLKLDLADASVAELAKKCDVVFTSNITSAAVDAYYSGSRIVQMLDGRQFNSSPLRGLEGVVYVNNPAELTAALLRSKLQERSLPKPYFFLDEGLPRWKKLLSNLSKGDI
jgi:surface carbohydrate biosynthesis protein (TIGR04326 family)